MQRFRKSATVRFTTGWCLRALNASVTQVVCHVDVCGFGRANPRSRGPRTGGLSWRRATRALSTQSFTIPRLDFLPGLALPLLKLG